MHRLHLAIVVAAAVILNTGAKPINEFNDHIGIIGGTRLPPLPSPTADTPPEPEMTNNSSVVTNNQTQTIVYNVLTAVSNDPPSAVFQQISHPIKPVYADPQFDKTVPTNSWISNLFYPSLNDFAPITPDPYTLRHLDDYGGNPGLSIRQASQKVYGSYPPVNNVPASEAGYMLNSAVVDLRFTCSEWGSVRPEKRITYWDHFTAHLRLLTPGDKDEHIDFPIARGMAYVTAIYHNLTPQFFTQNAIIDIKADLSDHDTYTGHKFKITMNDNPTSTYIIYALGDAPLVLRKVGVSNLVAHTTYNGPVRIAKLPSPDAEAILDNSKSIWAVGGELSASSDGSTATYSIRWLTNQTDDGQLLTYAYPHHIDSLQDIHTLQTSLVLESATKGPMRAVQGNHWTLQETKLSPVEWLPVQSQPEEYAINDIMEELNNDIESNYSEAVANMDNYFGGKSLQKFAFLALLLNKPSSTGLHNAEMAKVALDKLKAVFTPFLNNKQLDPYRYDDIYKGIVARDGLPLSFGGTGNPDAEFGHTYYNDHHYHHGYLIVTAAIIHHLDPKWRAADIISWTETLIRDVNSPADNDPYFLPFRNWDWFAGHSWAGGIKVNGALDGRDQESVPESVNFYWGVKLWGLARENRPLVNLASLQLAITKRTAFDYFWMLDSNKNRPKKLIKNKVIGIYFEQKTDYTTYFGRYLEYIHGIQQLPMTPELADYIRIPEFVTEEWDQKLSSIAPTLQTPWAGVLYLNYALINPSTAYAHLKKVPMDDGQTLSYSLYLAATRPGFHMPGLAALAGYQRPVQSYEKHGHMPTIRRLNLTNTDHHHRYKGY